MLTKLASEGFREVTYSRNAIALPVCLLPVTSHSPFRPGGCGANASWSGVQEAELLCE